MTIKRGSIVLITGIALEGALLWAVDHFAHFNLCHRIVWNNLFLWGFFAAGFTTAWWLIGWSRLLYKLFTKKKITPPQPSTEPIKENRQELPQHGEQTLQSEASAPPQRAIPMRMNVQNNAVMTITPQEAATIAPAPNLSAAPVAPAPNLSATPATPLSSSSQKDQDIKILADLDTDLDMMAFKHVALDGKVLDLVYSSDDIAVLCKVFSEPHTWQIDTTQTIDNATWRDETGATQQPCLSLLSQAAILEKMEASAKIIPTFVLMRGTIQNYEEARHYFEQNQIALVKYQNGENEHFKTLHDLLIENFALFPEGFNANTPELEGTPAHNSTQPEGE